MAGTLALAAGVAYALAGVRSLDLSDGVRSLLGWYFVAAVVGVAAVQLRIQPAAAQVYEGIDSAARQVALLGGLLGRLEAERFHAARLAELRARLDVAGEPPSRQVARLTRLMEHVDSRHNAFAWLLGFFLVWDVHLAHAVERWRLASGPKLGTWLDTVGEMEALASLAAYRFERPDDTWPELADGTPCFEAQALAHPLLNAKAVANDVRLDGRPQVLVLSGSNMSGKSHVAPRDRGQRHSRAGGRAGAGATAGDVACGGRRLDTHRRLAAGRELPLSCRDRAAPGHPGQDPGAGAGRPETPRRLGVSAHPPRSRSLRRSTRSVAFCGADSRARTTR